MRISVELVNSIERQDLRKTDHCTFDWKGGTLFDSLNFIIIPCITIFINSLLWYSRCNNNSKIFEKILCIRHYMLQRLFNVVTTNIGIHFKQTLSCNLSSRKTYTVILQKETENNLDRSKLSVIMFAVPT